MLEAGLRAIADCRTALAYSYVEAYFCSSQAAALLFTHAQSQLEEFTDMLQVCATHASVHNVAGLNAHQSQLRF